MKRHITWPPNPLEETGRTLLTGALSGPLDQLAFLGARSRGVTRAAHLRPLDERLHVGLSQYVSSLLASGASVVQRLQDGNWIAMLDAKGQPAVTFDPPVGPQYPLKVGRSWSAKHRMTVAATGQGDRVRDVVQCGSLREVPRLLLHRILNASNAPARTVTRSPRELPAWLSHLLFGTLLSGCASFGPQQDQWQPAPVGASWVSVQRSTGSFGNREVQIKATRGASTWKGAPVASVTRHSRSIVTLRALNDPGKRSCSGDRSRDDRSPGHWYTRGEIKTLKRVNTYRRAAVR